MIESRENTHEQAPDYLAYLLRLWRIRGPGNGNWRASLVSPSGTERYSFASLDDLVLFLRQQTQMQSSANGAGEMSTGDSDT